MSEDTPLALATMMEVARVGQTVALVTTISADELVEAYREGEPLRVMACFQGAEHVERVKKALSNAVTDATAFGMRRK